jgi:hypothetical protein
VTTNTKPKFCASWSITIDNYCEALATIRWDEVTLTALGQGDDGSSTHYASDVLEGALLVAGKFHVVNTLAIQLNDTLTPLENITQIIEAVAAWSSTDRFVNVLFTNDGIEHVDDPRPTSDPVPPTGGCTLDPLIRSQLVNLRVAIDRLRVSVEARDGWGRAPLVELSNLCDLVKKEISSLWLSEVDGFDWVLRECRY